MMERGNTRRRVVWVPFPFDKVLQFASSAKLPRVQNLLNLIFFFIINQVWRWSRVIWTMDDHLVIWCEKINEKDVMNTPLCGKFQSIIDRGHHLDNGKRAMPLGCKFYHWLICMYVMSFQPHEVSFLVLGHIFMFDP